MYAAPIVLLFTPLRKPSTPGGRLHTSVRRASETIPLLPSPLTPGFVCAGLLWAQQQSPCEHNQQLNGGEDHYRSDGWPREAEPPLRRDTAEGAWDNHEELRQEQEAQNEGKPGEKRRWSASSRYRRACWPASQSWNSRDGMAMTCIRIRACQSPQNSAHSTRYVPGSDASTQRSLVRPGTMSILPMSRGTQKLWMTSLELICKSTGSPAGIRISFTSENPCSGYRTS